MRFIYVALLLLALLACGQESKKLQAVVPLAPTTASTPAMSQVSASGQAKSQPAAQEELRPQISSPAERQATFQAHKLLQQEWLNGARLVVERTNDPEAQAVLEFLLPNVFLMEPLDGGAARVLEDRRGKPYSLGMLVVTEQDMQRLPQIKEEVKQRGGGAEYVADSRVIIVKGSDMSPVWRGLILLHEGSHAKDFANSPRERGDLLRVSRDEAVVHDFQNRLAMKLGGTAYAKLLDAEVLSIAEQVQRLPSPAPGQLAFLGGRSKYNVAFEEIFGPSASVFERALRQSSFMVHAQFAYIEQMYGSRGPAYVLEVKSRYYQQLRLKRVRYEEKPE